MDPWVTIAVAVITGLATMVGTLGATIVALRNTHQAEHALVIAQYHQLLEDMRQDIVRLKARVAELEGCLRRRPRREGDPE